MGRVSLALFGIIAVAGIALAADPASESAEQPSGRKTAASELTTDKQKSSYAIGYNIGMKISQQFGADGIDLRSLVVGMQDAFASRKPAVAGPEMQQALKRHIAEVEGKEKKNRAAKGAINKQKGEQFLAKNKRTKGVVVLPDGLQYLVLKDGTGKQPKATDEVEVHYHGTLIDGTVFDSSVERGEPASFPLNGVIPGWTEVVQLMKEGAKWRVFVPSDLAYGKDGRPPKIGPNETLVFEIELLHVK